MLAQPRGGGNHRETTCSKLIQQKTGDVRHLCPTYSIFKQFINYLINVKIQEALSNYYSLRINELNGEYIPLVCS